MIIFLFHYVVPQNFPSHISQHMASEVPKLLKKFQEFDQTSSPPKHWAHKLGFWLSQGQMDFWCFKWLSWFIIGLQYCSYQVSSLASQICSVNCSDDWKLTVLGKKLIMVNIQSNLVIFGQHQHFEVIFIIWSKFVP